jgi:cell division septation protein DedD
MRKSVLFGIFVIGVLATIFYVYYYQSSQQDVSLGEIFSEEEYPVDVEYEFIGKDGKPIIESASAGSVKKPALKIEPDTEVVLESTNAVVSVSAAQTVAVESTVTTVPASERGVLAQQALTKIPYTIQVASLKDKAKAEEAVQDLKTKKYDGFIVSRDLGDKGIWHRVYVGKFNAKSDAEDFLTKIQQDFPGSFVIAPR